MKNIPLLFSIVLIFFSCKESNQPTLGEINFDDILVQDIKSLESNFGKWSASDSVASIIATNSSPQKKSIRIEHGEAMALEFEPNQKALGAQYYHFIFKKNSWKIPAIEFEEFETQSWKKVNPIKELKWNNAGQGTVTIPAIKVPSSKIRMVITSESDVLLEELQFLTDAPMTVDTVSTYQPVIPVLIGKNDNPVIQIKIVASGINEPQRVTQFRFTTIGTTDINDIENIKVYSTGNDTQFLSENLFGETNSIDELMTINGETLLSNGVNYFWLSYTVKNNTPLDHKVDAQLEKTSFSNGKSITPSPTQDNFSQRIGHALRQHWDDSVHTYRIPGLATTNKGTLIGVYDLRYNSSVDLQEDVDVGLSRSTDEGNTWEDMKVIMDMKEWGGKPESENGIGDPSVLVDRSNNTIWVAGIWAHGHPGKRNWHASKPGMTPEETSQFILVKSEDDGVTWSNPINITKQIKKPKWQLMLQGPGKGITLKNGTLVFPAQYKDEERVPHSTIIYSSDHGKTWKIGTGAKSKTTEAQVVELEDGALMLNMRDDRGRVAGQGARSVAITYDLGATWTEHPTSRKALEEPVCMASLITTKIDDKQVLFFSNPADKYHRKNMTVKASFDQGNTWPNEYHLLLDQGRGRGYSCMTMIDENTIGILYEGSQSDLVFERIKVSEIIK